MVPRLRRITLAVCLLGSTFVTAQESKPQPIPPFEEAPIRRLEPEVAYADGKLRITARLATLGDVLGAIHSRTCAVISAPPEIAAQQISLKVGPATVLDVITDLLDTAECNYVVVGSQARPASIRVSVTRKPTEPELTAFAHQAEATLSEPGNKPDSPIVTVTEPVVEAQSTTSTKESEKPAPESADGNSQSNVAAPK